MYTFKEILNDSRTTISDFLSEDKNYDTRKVTNRSNVVISEEIIQEIDLQGVTLERLDELKVPVFKYITQVTLHGVFSGVSTTRIGGYQNLIVNQNQTLGVKYTAIDLPKKKIIGNALKYFQTSDTTQKSKFYLQTDSKGSTIFLQKRITKDKVKETYDELKVVFDKIPDNFVGKKSIGTYSFMGIYTVAIIIDFKAILEANLFPFISSITFCEISNEPTYKDKKYVYNEKERIEKQDRDEKYRIQSEQEANEDDKHQIVINARIKEIASSMPLPVFEGDLPKGEYILAVLGMISLREEKAGFKVFYVKKGSFGRVLFRNKNFPSYQEINLNPEFDYGDKSKVFEKSVQKNLESYVKRGKCYLLAPLQQVKNLHKINKPEVAEKVESKIVTKSSTQNDVYVTAKPYQETGKLLIEVTGNHKQHKEFIKSQGVKAWDGEKLRWWTKYGTPAQYEALVAYFGNSEGNAPTPTISSPQKPLAENAEPKFDFEKFESLAKTFNVYDRKDKDLDAQETAAEMLYLMLKSYDRAKFLAILNDEMSVVETYVEQAGIINYVFFMECFIGYAKYEFRDKSKSSKIDDYGYFELKYYLNKLSL